MPIAWSQLEEIPEHLAELCEEGTSFIRSCLLHHTAGFEYPRDVLLYDAYEIWLRIPQLAREDVSLLVDIAAEAVFAVSPCSLDVKPRTISSGDARIDKRLHNGILAAGITEISGESGSGKTQLCLQIAASFVLQEPGSTVLYLCADSSFVSERYYQIAQAMRELIPHPLEDSDPGTRVLIQYLGDLDLQIHFFKYCLPAFVEQHGVGLVIVDSIAANMRAVDPYLNDSHRAAMIHDSASSLRSIADQFGVCVICVNQVSGVFVSENSRSPELTPRHEPALDLMPFYLNKNQRDERLRILKPSLGLSWSNCVNTRIILTRNDCASSEPAEPFVRRYMYIVFSPFLPSQCIPFTIAISGLRGVNK